MNPIGTVKNGWYGGNLDCRHAAVGSTISDSCPFGAVLFDKLIASMRVVGIAVFAIDLADSVVYSGSVGVQCFRDIVANPVRVLHSSIYSYFGCVA